MKTNTRLGRKNVYVALALATMMCLTTAGTGPSAFELFDAGDVAAVGAAYMTHLSLHELGHLAVGNQVGAESPQMRLFTNRNGRFYPGLSTYKKIPEKSKLPYAAAGEQMAGYTFEYALNAHRAEPTTYNKALMFFSCADFVVYTLLANYAHPHSNLYDPNIIQHEIGCSKNLLLSLVATKSLVNAYRVFHPGLNFIPIVWTDDDSAAMLFQVRF